MAVHAHWLTRWLCMHTWLTRWLCMHTWLTRWLCMHTWLTRWLCMHTWLTRWLCMHTWLTRWLCIQYALNIQHPLIATQSTTPSLTPPPHIPHTCIATHTSPVLPAHTHTQVNQQKPTSVRIVRLPCPGHRLR